MNIQTKAIATLVASTALVGLAPLSASAAVNNYAYNQRGSAHAINTYTDNHCSTGRFVLSPGQHKRAHVQSFKVNATVRFKTDTHGYRQWSSNQCIDVNNGREDYTSVFVYNV